MTNLTTTNTKSTKETKSMNKKNGVARWVVGVSAGLLLFTMGAVKGQFSDIYRKAVMICLECIGIG